MRVSNPMMSGHVLSWLTQAQERLFASQAQAASGRRILHASDDPAGTARAQTLRSDQARNAQYLADIDAATLWLKSAESAMKEIGAAVTSLRDLAVQGASTGVDEAVRGSLASLAQQVCDRLADLANTKVNGRYIFAGQATANQPFTPTGGTPPLAYGGTTTPPAITISPGLTVQVGITGNRLFNMGGTVDPTQDDLFTTAANLVQLLASGQPADISAIIADLDFQLAQVLACRGEVGARLQTCEVATSRLEAVQADLTSTLTTIEDADLAEVMVELAAQQNALQAAAGVAASLNQVSLLDYLK